MPLWFWLLWRIDVKRFYRPVRGNVPTPPAPAGEDEDVAAERARAEAMAGGGPDGGGPPLLLQNLRKTFASPRVKGVRQPRKVAVDNLSLAVDGGCFSLLGPNGAGKTTTLSMLTGAAIPHPATTPPRRLTLAPPPHCLPCRRPAAGRWRRVGVRLLCPHAAARHLPTVRLLPPGAPHALLPL